MNEISCLIKEQTTIEDKIFYIIQDCESKEDYLIPKNQIPSLCWFATNKLPAEQTPPTSA